VKRLCLLQLLVVALIWGWEGLPQASLLRAMSLRELVSASDSIVLAKVVSVQSAWDSSHRRIASTIEIDIEQAWKGQPSAAGRASIVQPGGTVGDIEMTVEGMPRFTPGERTLLFLHGRVHPQVVGLSQGKRTLQLDTQTGRWLVQSADTTAAYERGADAKVRHARPTSPVDLDDFRAQIESLLRQ